MTKDRFMIFGLVLNHEYIKSNTKIKIFIL